eukprot:TRINITY_DN70111_c0_g1_i1.p1 TRINITY_DN70111_c0_g1~~TRINITY_DN70111_c0_g1_i1.p1  ORF type:complete len:189 (+),score=24.85 TRINITY_DN70111_c0_g1_i1:30-596(+)
MGSGRSRRDAMPGGRFRPAAATGAGSRGDARPCSALGGLNWLVVFLPLLMRCARAQVGSKPFPKTPLPTVAPDCPFPSCPWGGIFCNYCLNGRFNICDKDIVKDCRCDDENCMIVDKLHRTGCTYATSCQSTTSTTTTKPDYGVIPALIVFTIPSITCIVLGIFCVIEKYCSKPTPKSTGEEDEELET